MTPSQIQAAIARRDESVIYERLEFDADGKPVICTYRASQPFVCIACRPANTTAQDTQ